MPGPPSIVPSDGRLRSSRGRTANATLVSPSDRSRRSNGTSIAPQSIFGGLGTDVHGCRSSRLSEGTR